RIAGSMIGFVGVRALAEQNADDLGLMLLHCDDQGSLAHPVGPVDLGAEPDQPFYRRLKSYTRGFDQRCIAVLAAEVGICALIKEEPRPLLVAPANGNNQCGVAVGVLGVDDALRMGVEDLDGLVAIALLHRLDEIVTWRGELLRNHRRSGEGGREKKSKS